MKHIMILFDMLAVAITACVGPGIIAEKRPVYQGWCSEQGAVRGIDKHVDVNVFVCGDASFIVLSKSSGDGRKKKSGRTYRPEE